MNTVVGHWTDAEQLLQANRPNAALAALDRYEHYHPDTAPAELRARIITVLDADKAMMQAPGAHAESGLDRA